MKPAMTRPYGCQRMRDAVVKAAFFVAAIQVVSYCSCSSRVPSQERIVGNERVPFSDSFDLPVDDEKRRYKEAWEREDMAFGGRLLSKDDFGDPADWPFRNDVKFAWHSPMKGKFLMVTDGSVYDVVRGESLGYFLKELVNSRQCEVVAKVLQIAHLQNPLLSHDSFLTADEVIGFLSKLETGPYISGLILRSRDVDRDLYSEGVRVRGDYWAVAFARIEESSLVEHRYYFANDCRIAHVKRVLVEGPPRRVPYDMPLDSKEIDTWPKEARERVAEYAAAVQFIDNTMKALRARTTK